MEDIIAVAVILDNDKRRYFLTWGRIQDPVNPKPVEQLVLKHCGRFALGGVPVKAKLCASLQEASGEPYFYECFFSLCQKTIPFGENYHAWKQEMNNKMQNGEELYHLGFLPSEEQA